MEGEGDGGRAEENNDSNRQESRHDDSERGDSRQYEKTEQEADYNSEPEIQPRYIRNTRDAKKSDKKESRKSAKKGGLEAIVNEQISKAREHNIDEIEYLSAHLHENISDYLEESDDSEAKEETWEGAVAIIHHKGEFLIEEEYGKEAGKLRLIGGAKEVYDFNTFETEAREIGEEIKEPAKSILLKYLRTNGTKYDTITNIVNGGEVKSDIIRINVASDKDWEIASKAQPTGGAGPFHVLTYDEIWSKPNSAFAFDHGHIIKKFILEEIVRNKSHLNDSWASYTNNYPLPIVTTNHNHLQKGNFYNKQFPSRPYDTNIPLKLAA